MKNCPFFDRIVDFTHVQIGLFKETKYPFVLAGHFPSFFNEWRVLTGTRVQLAVKRMPLAVKMLQPTCGVEDY